MVGWTSAGLGNRLAPTLTLSRSADPMAGWILSRLRPFVASVLAVDSGFPKLRKAAAPRDAVGPHHAGRRRLQDASRASRAVVVPPGFAWLAEVTGDGLPWNRNCLSTFRNRVTVSSQFLNRSTARSYLNPRNWQAAVRSVSCTTSRASALSSFSQMASTCSVRLRSLRRRHL
jgi:hypothetical protein